MKSSHHSKPAIDHTLLQLIAAGSEQAFAALFKELLPRLYPYARKFTGSELGAEEVVQETFIRIWMSRDKLPGLENPNSWLFKVAANECYSYLRKKILTDKFSYDSDAEPPPENNIHVSIDAKEIKELVSIAVNGLSEQRKKIFIMSRIDGKSIPEIATELGLSPNTVKNTLVTTLKQLREYLEKAGALVVLFLLMKK